MTYHETPEHLAHDLFLLMLTLSQLRDPARTVSLFVESMNALQGDVRVHYVDNETDPALDRVSIATNNNHFGYIALQDIAENEAGPLSLALVRNAIRMLAVVLENQKRAHLLTDENMLLEALVKQRAADLQLSEERFRSTFEQAAVGIAHVAPDGRFLRINQRFCEIVGRSPEDMLSLRFVDITHENDRETDRLNSQRLLSGELATYITEKRYIRGDGSLIWVNLTVSLLNAPDGAPRYFISVVEDISDRKRAEEELAQYRDHLEELVAERTAELRAANEELRVLGALKDEFVANVSHELRTPITNMVLREHLLRQRPEDWDQHLPVIERETVRLSHIIDDLLVLACMEQGTLEVNQVDIDLNQLTRQYITDRSVLAESQELTVVWQGAPTAPVVRADEGLLEQALSILTTNAFNYTPKGGKITVAVRLRQNETEQWAGIVVSDTGWGIAPDEIPHLFDRFFRGKAAHKSGAHGTGLGLAILKRIVDQHHGQIDVESDGIPGHGTTFSIWLPTVKYVRQNVSGQGAESA